MPSAAPLSPAGLARALATSTTFSVTVSTIRCTCGRCGGGGMVYGSAYPYGETCPVCGGKGHDETTIAHPPCVAYEVQSA